MPWVWILAFSGEGQKCTWCATLLWFVVSTTTPGCGFHQNTIIVACASAHMHNLMSLSLPCHSKAGPPVTRLDGGVNDMFLAVIAM